MGAKWLRVESDVVDHPKVMRLAVVLGEPLADAFVLRTWCWLSRFCPTGQVRDTDGTSLETACRWRGEAGALLRGLVEVGLFGGGGGGGGGAHDWAEHQGKVAARAQKEAERKRAYRAKMSRGRPADVPWDNARDISPRPAQRDVTGRDVTGRKEEALSGKPDDGAAVEPKPDRTPASLESKLSDDEWQVFEHWRVTLNHPKAVASAERKRLIAKWLPTYGVDRLMDAIDGCKRSPHHMGQNERHQRYDSLELILRDAKHIEMFEALAKGRAA